MTVSEGVIDNRESGSSELTLSADLSASGETVSVGDDVTVAGYLKPSEAAELASGSLKMSYDNQMFALKGVTLSESLSSINTSDNVRLTSDDSEIVASFTTGDTALSVGEDGLAMFTAVFTALKASDTPAVFAVTDAAGSKDTTELVVDSEYPTTQVTVKYPEVTCESFGGDYYIVKYGADEQPEEGQSYFLNGEEMTCVPAYSSLEGLDGKYVYVLLTSSEPDNLIPAEAATEAAKTVESASGDANMNGKTNIVDAQVAYYMLSGEVTSETDGIDWLNSDVNGDSTITALDCQAIQYFVHYGEFGQFR